jgi:hypothetical protein
MEINTSESNGNITNVSGKPQIPKGGGFPPYGIGGGTMRSFPKMGGGGPGPFIPRTVHSAPMITKGKLK